MTSIDSVLTLPFSPFNGTGTVGIVITSSVPTYFKVSGAGLDRIISVNWYPQNPASVEFKMRELILVDNTLGTFMVMVTDNHYYDYDRGGHISFRLDNETTLTFPVKTFGRVSVLPLWNSPESGVNTG